MLTIAKRRSRRKEHRRGKARPAVRPLTLVSASFTPEAPPAQAYVRLTFDRAVNAAGWTGDALSLLAGDDVQTRYDPDPDAPLTNVTPDTIQITLLPQGSYEGDETTLTVNAANGIRAADNGGVWDGVNLLGLAYEVSALLLMSAEFEVTTSPHGVLRLGFDLPLDVSEVVDMTEIQVYAGGREWRGQLPVTLLDPMTLQVPMLDMGPMPRPGPRVYADGGTNLHPVGNPTGTWEGVRGVDLPY